MYMKKALFGAHDSYPSSVEFLEILAKTLKKSYDVTIVESVDAMLEKMGIPFGSSSITPPENHFDLYIMEVNQGYPGGKTFEPASIIYQHVKDLVENGTVKFVAISGTSEAIEAAKSAGIPCIDKYKFNVQDYR